MVPSWMGDPPFLIEAEHVGGRTDVSEARSWPGAARPTRPQVRAGAGAARQGGEAQAERGDDSLNAAPGGDRPEPR
jgi:hypothetical protein